MKNHLKMLFYALALSFFYWTFLMCLITSETSFVHAFRYMDF